MLVQRKLSAEYGDSGTKKYSNSQSVKMFKFQITFACYVSFCLLCKFIKGNFNFLKLMSAIFYQIFIFSSSDRSSKTMKNVFYFILKALFVLKIFKFLYFFPFLYTMSKFKRASGSGITYDVINWLA